MNNSLTIRQIANHYTGADKFEFFGLKMTQIPEALILLSTLLQTTRPSKIIEFGTGYGGLSVLFNLYAKINDISFITYDNLIHRQDILNVSSIDFRKKDLLQEDTRREIIGEISSNVDGPTVLFCDCLKSAEANFYSKYCKKGDIILVHDYVSDPSSPKFRDIQLKYNWTAPFSEHMGKLQECLHNGFVLLNPNCFEEVLMFCAIKSI